MKDHLTQNDIDAKIKDAKFTILEDEYNKIFGEQIAKVADIAILIGEKKTQPIKEGLLTSGFDKDKIVVFNDEIDDTVDKIEAILKAEKCRVDRIEEVYLDTKEEEIHELLMEDEEVFVNTGLGDKLQ